jgi:cation diffusion facilitator family transporter
LQEENSFKIKTMRIMLAFSLVIMLLKFYAFYITFSTAILTDALESIINVVAGAFALFSISYAAQPKDANHPYGHGKIEYISAGFEGGLILIAGLAIIIKSIFSFFQEPTLHSLDLGVMLSTVSGLANLIMGRYLIKNSSRTKSTTMKANGKHLVSDAVTSAGLIIGLGTIYFTGLNWLDPVIAIIFALLIFRTGIKLIKESISNLLDEADEQQLQKLTEIINKNRRKNWIDIHNLRVLKYGSFLHVDCHLTLPWYLSLEQSHDEVSSLENLIRKEMGNEIEFFIHADPCLPASCSLCGVENCASRKRPFVTTVEWNLKNMVPDNKHTI